MSKNALIVIDPILPIALLDVADVLDNQHWKFCQDDPDADTATYGEFEMGPDFILMTGTTVRINHLWGFLPQAGLSDAADYQITIPTAASVKHVVHVLLSQYHHDMDKLGSDGRFYYIEQVSGRNGVVEIVWGT
jgi:hypothetical protein